MSRKEIIMLGWPKSSFGHFCNMEKPKQTFWPTGRIRISLGQLCVNGQVTSLLWISNQLVTTLGIFSKSLKCNCFLRLFSPVPEVNFTIQILYHGMCFNNKVGHTISQISTVVIIFHFEY